MDPQPYADLHQLLEAGQTEEALAALQTRVADRPEEWQQVVSLLQARYSALKKKEMMGMIDLSDADVQRNQINHGLLEVLEGLEANAPSAARLLDELARPPAPPPAPVAAAAPVAINQTGMEEASIEVTDSRDVVIGSGNTVTRKIFNALGRWQFIAIGAGLVVLGLLWYVLRGEMATRDEASFATLNSIQAELARLAGSDPAVAAWSPAQRQQVEASLAGGVQALENGRFREAVQQLQEVAGRVELATVHKNLAYAYEQLGDWENAFRERQIAERIDPSVYPDKTLAELRGRRVNLLERENGGKMLAANHPAMARLSDHSISASGTSATDWAVYGFRDGRSATIDRVDFYVAESSNINVQEFELLVGDESPTGPFRSIGKFKPYNGFLTETPFQSFAFAPVKARYVRYQTVTGTWFYEIRLWGEVE